MAAKAIKAKEAFVQYSKKMCTRVTIFWMIYRVVNFIVVMFRPEIANALVDLSAGVDTIMIVNMSVYTFNSGTEKIAIAFGKRKSLYSGIDDKDDSDDEDGAETEEDNG